MTVENIYDQSPQKNVAILGGGQTCNLLVISRTCIGLSHEDNPYQVDILLRDLAVFLKTFSTVG